MLKEKKLKSKDIALELGVTERMVRKYIDDIKESGIEIVTAPGPKGGYYIPKADVKKKADEQFSLRVTFTNDEEKDSFLEYLTKEYELTFISRPYENTRSIVEGERRIYMDIVKKTS